MSKHLTGSKRLAVIQRWINGIDDPEWEVLPTRTEGKYIVKKRKTELPEQTQEEEETQETQETEETQEEEETQETQETEELEERPKKITKPKKTSKSKKTQETHPAYDPTINLEILNQLKLLGEEIKNKRERKEQKRLIKEVVDKRIRKPKKFVQEYEDDDDEEPVQKEQPRQVQYVEMQPRTFIRRNRIFGDMS